MAGYGVTTKHFRESESQAVGMAGDLRAGRQTHGSGPGWTAPAGAEGAETPGAVSGAEAELKRREKADAQGGRGRLKCRRAAHHPETRYKLLLPEQDIIVLGLNILYFQVNLLPLLACVLNHCHF